MGVLKAIFSFLIFCGLSAQEMNLVAIGQANVERAVIAFGYDGENIMTGRRASIRDSLLKILRDDFKFYKQFFQVSESGISNSFPFNAPDFNTFTDEGILYFGQIRLTDENPMSYTVSLFNIKSEKKIATFDGVISRRDLREKTHLLAHHIYKSLTGRDSIFQGQIIFVSDRGSTKKRPIKELYIMDFDGENKRKLTNHKAIVMSPSISPDREKILYTLIKNRGRKRNVNLRMYDRKTKKSTLLSSRKGINSGAIFMPDSKSILLTLSFRGNAEIYKMDLSTRKIVPLTQDRSLDVDPSIRRDGSLMTFLSGRSGEAHVYTMDPSGIEKGIERISFVGKFNATPRFSPDGSEIAFASWIDPRFDIVRIGSDGKNLVRLTRDFGSNEDPTYSNDSQFIAFSSQRVLSRTHAIHNIYVMTRDGDIIKPLTVRYGNCITPRWTR